MKNSSEKITNCIKIRNVLNEMHSSDDVARLTCYFCQNKIRDEKKKKLERRAKKVPRKSCRSMYVSDVATRHSLNFS